MSGGPIFKLPFKRKRTKKTDYTKRLNSLKSKKDRFVIRISNKLVTVQIIDYNKDGDFTKLSLSSHKLKDYGWNHSLKNTSAIYLISYLLAKQALKKNIKEVIFDLGLKNYDSKTKVFAGLKAIVDAGLNCPYDKKAFPDEKRITGEAFEKHLNKNISKSFLEVKKKIESE